MSALFRRPIPDQRGVRCNVWVSRVRRKLGAAPGEPGRIRTFQGIGYLLDVDPPTPRHQPAADIPVRQVPELIG
jgi:DNA-binding winged helix-turn-helix (wHTH) protein